MFEEDYDFVLTAWHILERRFDKSGRRNVRVCLHIFAPNELIDGYMKGKLSVRSFCCLALEKYAPQSKFSYEKHVRSSRKSTIQFVANIYNKNKQRFMNDKVRKDSAKTFKSRERNKEI